MRVEIRAGAADDVAVVARVDDVLPAGEVARDGRQLRVGTLEGWGADGLRAAAAAAARSIRHTGGEIGWRARDEDEVRAIVEGTAFGAYDAGLRKRGYGDLPEISLVVDADETLRPLAERQAVVARHVSNARDLSNLPPNELTPPALADHAAALGLAHLTAMSLGRDEIVELGMGAFAAVAQGSPHDPRLIVLRYDPPVADLGLPVRAIGVVASTENVQDAHAFKPGDILRASNGKTIEIMNTDAEGRLVLADALHYAREQGATHLADFATLTGAMNLALGDLYAGYFANDDEWAREVQAAADRSGDLAWRFPLHPRYRRYIDSTFADMKNGSDLKEGSPVLAAEFLREFAGHGPWAHVDMAGPGYVRRKRPDYVLDEGGTGYGVRLIVELAARLAA